MKVFLLFYFISSLYAEVFYDFRSVEKEKIILVKKGIDKEYCSICGMYLPRFYKTNYIATHNHHKDQYCSLSCLVSDVEVNKRKLYDIQAVDLTSLKFVNVKKGYFVEGSQKPGTMSMVSKYTFISKNDAQEFIKKFGGTLRDFQTLYQNEKKRTEKMNKNFAKLQKQKSHLGKIMYEKMCKKGSYSFTSSLEAREFILSHHICKKMKEKYIEAIAIFLTYKRLREN